MTPAIRTILSLEGSIRARAHQQARPRHLYSLRLELPHDSGLRSEPGLNMGEIIQKVKPKPTIFRTFQDLYLYHGPEYLKCRLRVMSQSYQG